MDEVIDYLEFVTNSRAFPLPVAWLETNVTAAAKYPGSDIERLTGLLVFIFLCIALSINALQLKSSSYKANQLYTTHSLIAINEHGKGNPSC